MRRPGTHTGDYRGFLDMLGRERKALQTRIDQLEVEVSSLNAALARSYLDTLELRALLTLPPDARRH